MDALIAGLLALTGVALGAWLNDFLASRRKARADREQELRATLAAAIRARTLVYFPYSAGGAGAPPGMTPRELKEFDKRIYLEGTDRYLKALDEARQRVAGLEQYGFSVDAWVNDGTFMRDSLEDIEAAIRAELRA